MSSVSSAPDLAKELLDTTLQSSVLLSPMKRPVMFIPCGHNEEKSIAQELFGKMQNGLCKNKGKPCPLCRSVVTAYYPNRSLRDITCRMLEIAPQEEEKEEAVVDPILSLLKITPYPGRKGIFARRGNWDTEHTVTFTSMKKHATVDSFMLYSSTGELTLKVSFSCSKKSAKDLLAPFGIELGQAPGMRFTTTNSDEIKKIIRMIEHFNQVGASDHELIARIIGG